MSVIIAMRRSFPPNWRHEGGSLVVQEDASRPKKCVEMRRRYVDRHFFFP